MYRKRIISKSALVLATAMTGIMLAGCALPFQQSSQNPLETETIPEDDGTAQVISQTGGTVSDDEEDSFDKSSFGEDEKGLFHYLDANDDEHEAYINPMADVNDYDTDLFQKGEHDIITYEDENYVSEFGIDVSNYNGDIDWGKVADAGCRFAIIRLGYRGYSEGGLKVDDHFARNMKGAAEAGIPVGVYFFSQAVNEAEAVEEADFVAENLQGYELQLPVFFDPERIGVDEARTDETTGDQFSLNALAFCSRIREKGYDPGVYINIMWQFGHMDMAAFDGITIWNSDYHDLPQTPYRFEYWQYSFEGEIDGMPEDTKVDLDLRLVPRG